MKLYIAILLFACSMTASACRPVGQKEFSSNSENAYDGVVTGLINSTLENSLDPDFESEEEQITVPASYTLRVFITGTIRGKDSEKVRLAGTTCSSSLKIGTKVFLFSNNDESEKIVLSHEFIKVNYPDVYRTLSNK
jgi:hypothetical protein